jgi:hypothetical protein
MNSKDLGVTVACFKILYEHRLKMLMKATKILPGQDSKRDLDAKTHMYYHYTYSFGLLLRLHDYRLSDTIFTGNVAVILPVRRAKSVYTAWHPSVLSASLHRFTLR